jgi:LAO/AO transport system kinase
MTALPSLEELRTGGKRIMARALAAIETAADSEELAGLLDAACAAPRAHVIGLTGPPGVGKSTLTSALIVRARQRRKTVGVIAVDPSSRRTGGALLGDRARIASDPADDGVYVRSMAARDRLGGLAEQTVAAMVLMRAVYDCVIVESVGIGQSESDISFVADTMLLCIQPASGDSLQFMKAGVMELPDIVVTKADVGAAARRARADVEGALTLVVGDQDRSRTPVVLVSATQETGLDELDEAIEQHRAWLGAAGRLAHRRNLQEQAWIAEAVRYRFGNLGLAVAPDLATEGGPFSRERSINHVLTARLRG